MVKQSYAWVNGGLEAECRGFAELCSGATAFTTFGNDMDGYCHIHGGNGSLTCPALSSFMANVAGGSGHGDPVGGDNTMGYRCYLGVRFSTTTSTTTATTQQAEPQEFQMSAVKGRCANAAGDPLKDMSLHKHRWAEHGGLENACRVFAESCAGAAAFTTFGTDSDGICHIHGSSGYLTCSALSDFGENIAGGNGHGAAAGGDGTAGYRCYLKVLGTSTTTIAAHSTTLATATTTEAEMAGPSTTVETVTTTQASLTTKTTTNVTAGESTVVLEDVSGFKQGMLLAIFGQSPADFLPRRESKTIVSINTNLGLSTGRRLAKGSVTVESPFKYSYMAGAKVSAEVTTTSTIITSTAFPDVPGAIKVVMSFNLEGISYRKLLEFDLARQELRHTIDEAVQHEAVGVGTWSQLLQEHISTELFAVAPGRLSDGSDMVKVRTEIKRPEPSSNVELLRSVLLTRSASIRSTIESKLWLANQIDTVRNRGTATISGGILFALGKEDDAKTTDKDAATTTVRPRPGAAVVSSARSISSSALLASSATMIMATLCA